MGANRRLQNSTHSAIATTMLQLLSPRSRWHMLLVLLATLMIVMQMTAFLAFSAVDQPKQGSRAADAPKDDAPRRARRRSNGQEPDAGGGSSATAHRANRREEEPNRSHDNKQHQQSTNEKNKKPLNILLFYADDWSFRTLGAMEEALNSTGYKVPRFVRTPNIDKLAASGMLFTHNCVTTSICMVSRASLYTGQYASVHKTYLPEDTGMYNETNWPRTLWPLLKSAGYHNGMVGKWHHASPPNASTDFATFHSYFGRHYESRDGKEEHVTDLNERDAVKFLNERPRNKPFALMVSFFAIHAEDGNPEQYRPQNRTAGLYRNSSVPIPKTATEEHFEAMPEFLQNPANVGRGRWMNRYSTPEMYQAMMKKTYRMITEVDTAIGNVVRKLEEQGALNDTLILFTTDNGNLHGEHGLAEKWYPYEESVRVPLVVVDPRSPEGRRGTVNDEYTLNIDLAPTMLSAAGVPVPDVMQGRDVAGMYLGTDEEVERTRGSWRKEFYYEWFTGHKVVIPASLALVSKRSKYIVYPEYGHEELFLLEDDPYEERNVFGTLNSPAAKEIKERFSRMRSHAESGARC